MSLLINSIVQRKNVEVHVVLIGKEREIIQPISNLAIIHKPSFVFNNNQRRINTFKTLFFIRSTIQKINPKTVLSFGEMWNNLTLLSLLGLNYPVFVSDRSTPDKNLGRFHNMLRSWLYPKARGIVAQTSLAKEVAEKRKWNENIEVIGNPIHQTVVSNEHLKENHILTIGRLIRTKHVDELVDIFAATDKHSEWKLYVVGGNAKGQDFLEELQKQLFLKDLYGSVYLEGRQTNVQTYYQRSKIFAFTSSSEGFPNVIGEAMAAGLAVIAYNCIAGPADLIDDGINGFLIPERNQELYKKRLQELINDESLRKRFGKEAKLKMKNFEVNKIADQFFNFITKLDA